MHLRLQIRSFNLIIGFSERYALLNFLKGYRYRTGKATGGKRTAKPLVKIALEILHIFRRNFGTKQPKLQNRPKFASHVGLLYTYLQHPSK